MNNVPTRIMLHACCGPCACFSTAQLIAENFHPTLFFYNPNIHPYQEYQSRLASLQDLGQLKNLPVLVESDYDLEQFLTLVAPNPTERCRHCYQMRLAKTALKAKELNFQIFSTTLLISPYQNRELLLEIGHENR